MSQAQKVKYCVFSLIGGFGPKTMMMMMIVMVVMVMVMVMMGLELKRDLGGISERVKGGFWGGVHYIYT
jgi:hypothetical protein